MNNVPRVTLKSCLVLSICIEDYGGGKSDRIGAQVDIANIRKTFGKDGYGFRIIENKSKTVDEKTFHELIEKTRKELVSNSDQYDGFIFFISAHGETLEGSPFESTVVLSDRNEIGVTDILDNFRNSNNGDTDDDDKDLGNKFLRKPKMFIFQACRGDEKLEPIDAPISDVLEKGLENGSFEESVKYVADQDIVLVQANTQGFKAWRSGKKGSYLIYETTNALSKNNKYNGYKEVSFDDAMYVVRNKILYATGLQKYESLQVLQVTSTVTSKIFFKK